MLKLKNLVLMKTIYVLQCIGKNKNLLYLLVKNYKCNSEIDNFIQSGQEFINNEN